MCNFNMYIAKILYHKNMDEGPYICKLDIKDSETNQPSPFKAMGEKKRISRRHLPGKVEE